MNGFVPGRTAGGTPQLTFAEHKSWENYLATVLRMTSVLNRQLTDTHKLSLSDVHLLDLLDKSPDGSAQMSALAEALRSLPSRLTRQVRRLEGQGLVERAISPHDRRRVIVTITEAGRTLTEEAMTTYANEVRTHFLGPLTRPQIAAMATSCRQIGDGLKQIQS
ncbi:MarR family winged helix-turn-helix transcriptional regulator [[Mycobacterium] nativiensis]|uniref:MarR family transcriptional regulator n=1 Tax=[Mycobacterium] nativiensis TaxID=2855503 RepID=A0ABU5Y0R9_9MYCO|nr:MarR family transcriptional regulator [Mycolicibacter sp. MYC340]MEB3033844.1 MarR family transcriptional regulator [Mycolicibacter sp. MYC340]